MQAPKPYVLTHKYIGTMKGGETVEVSAANHVLAILSHHHFLKVHMSRLFWQIILADLLWQIFPIIVPVPSTKISQTRGLSGRSTA